MAYFLAPKERSDFQPVLKDISRMIQEKILDYYAIKQLNAGTIAGLADRNMKLLNTMRSLSFIRY